MVVRTDRHGECLWAISEHSGARIPLQLFGLSRYCIRDCPWYLQAAHEFLVLHYYATDSLQLQSRALHDYLPPRLLNTRCISSTMYPTDYVAGTLARRCWINWVANIPLSKESPLFMENPLESRSITMHTGSDLTFTMGCLLSRR